MAGFLARAVACLGYLGIELPDGLFSATTRGTLPEGIAVPEPWSSFIGGVVF